MNRYHEERNFLLYIAGSGVSRRKIPGTLHESDYAAVYTPPKNTPIPIVGPCLIWRYGLNTGGYGALWLNGKKRTAHSVAYEMTRGEFLLEESVLHLCHRRCCIQPAHLYAGSAKENREDTDLRLTEKGRWRAPSLAFSKYGPLMKDGMRHYWDEPALTQPSSVADRVCRTSELWHTLHRLRHKERKDASETISGAIDSGRAQGTGWAGEHGNRVGATLKTGSHPADGR